jgi:hypothetical protein
MLAAGFTYRLFPLIFQPVAPHARSDCAITCDTLLRTLLPTAAHLKSPRATAMRSGNCPRRMMCGTVKIHAAAHALHTK